MDSIFFKACGEWRVDKPHRDHGESSGWTCKARIFEILGAQLLSSCSSFLMKQTGTCSNLCTIHCSKITPHRWCFMSPAFVQTNTHIPYRFLSFYALSSTIPWPQVLFPWIYMHLNQRNYGLNLVLGYLIYTLKWPCLGGGTLQMSRIFRKWGL